MKCWYCSPKKPPEMVDAPDKRCLVCPECGATASYSEAKKKEKKDAKAEPEVKT